MTHWKKHILLLLLPFALITACEEASKQDKGKAVESHAETEETTDDAKELPQQVLQKGQKKKAVRTLQQALKKIGYPITVSGQYDQDTTWAITDFQIQQEDTLITGIYESETKQALEEVIHNEKNIEPGQGISYPKEKNATIAENPYEVLVLVNKKHALPADFIPDDLVVPDVPFPFTEDLPKKMMRKPAAYAMEEMFQAAKEEDIELYAQSGYRSYERQEALFTAYIERDGEEAANKYSARPGESEHQSGLTMDVTSPAVDFLLNQEFGQTEEGKWLEENCHSYGFIIRYPKGKEDITSYQYEPWHIRYVGKEAAKEIMHKKLTLEEYLAQLEV